MNDTTIAFCLIFGAPFAAVAIVGVLAGFAAALRAGLGVWRG